MCAEQSHCHGRGLGLPGPFKLDFTYADQALSLRGLEDLTAPEEDCKEVGMDTGRRGRIPNRRVWLPGVSLLSLLPPLSTAGFKLFTIKVSILKD